jgi:pyruvate/2-oxoglutarate dehydrogenase complex dihydrolipoamide dehydrogenase (E3) component
VSRHFDAIIIGTGQAGPPMAVRFSEVGKTVAIIERVSGMHQTDANYQLVNALYNEQGNSQS